MVVSVVFVDGHGTRDGRENALQDNISLCNTSMKGKRYRPCKEGVKNSEDEVEERLMSDTKEHR